MGNESPGHLRPTTLDRMAFAVAVAVTIAFVASLPDNARAHGDEKHTIAPVEVPEVAHDAEGHERPEAVTEEAEAPSGHPYPPAGVPRPLAWLGKFHPVATHFPIALLSVAALAELLLLRRPRAPFREAVRFSVWVGAIGAVLAAPLGWFFGGFHIVDHSLLMTAHRWLGTGTAVWGIVILLLCERVYRHGADRGPFRLALFLGAALVAATGFLGGSLIYGLDHYAW